MNKFLLYSFKLPPFLIYSLAETIMLKITSDVELTPEEEQKIREDIIQSLMMYLR
jgi:hypothetical protein